MTAIDLLIIAVTIYAIWRGRLLSRSKRPSAPQIGLRLIALGLVGICLFYFVDLLSMYVSPAVMSRQAAVAFMDSLHQNASWFAVLFAMIAISSGFIELRRTQIELAEKNELLADLSSKLAKFLPAQLYNSIFRGKNVQYQIALYVEATIAHLRVSEQHAPRLRQTNDFRPILLLPLAMIRSASSGNRSLQRRL
jgi:Na+/H+ antiporter NhaC